MKPGYVLWICLLLSPAAAAPADLSRVMAESNLEKRSKLALEHADDTLKAARKAYQEGRIKESGALVREVRESVELADKSLKETGKDPRRSPKWFKRAEIQLRDLLKKLDAFAFEMDVNDRPMLEKARAGIQRVHENLLIGLMEGKRK